MTDLRLAAAVAIAAFVAAPTSARAQAATIAVLPVKLLDTAGEPGDQGDDHARRLAQMAQGLADDFRRSGAYANATTLSAASLAKRCPIETTACLLGAAKAEGAGYVFLGVVHKSSSLIMQLFAQVVDAETGARIVSRELNFRGDTDEAWLRARAFLVENLRRPGDDGALR